MTLEEIKEELGVCDDDNVVCYSSELKDAPKATGTNTGNKGGYTRKTTTTVRRFSASGGGSYHRYEARYWPEDEVDLKDDSENMLYVNWFNYETVLDNGKSINVRSLNSQFEDMGITMRGRAFRARPEAPAQARERRRPCLPQNACALRLEGG